MKDLEKLFSQAPEVEKAPMSDQEKSAKLDVIKELMAEMLELMGGQVKSGLDEMKKVTVAAPNDELLAEGLDVAKEVVPELGESDDVPVPQAMEAKEDDADDLYSLMQKKKNRLKG